MYGVCAFFSIKCPQLSSDSQQIYNSYNSSITVLRVTQNKSKSHCA